MPRRRNKFGAIKTVVEGIKFDSRAEAEHWVVLRELERLGTITNLRRQVPFRLEVNGFLICKYLADFCYDESGVPIVVDVKGRIMPVYALKKKLMRACLGIEIREINVTRRPRAKKKKSTTNGTLDPETTPNSSEEG